MTEESEREQAPADKEPTASERAFFERGDSWGGAPVPDDYVDTELASLEGPPSLLQPVLILLVLGFASFLAWQYRHELAYTFSSSEARELGNLTEEEGSFSQSEELPDNKYVKLSGIGVERVDSGNKEYRRLLGTHIYIQLKAGEEDGGAVDTFGEYTRQRGVRQVVGGKGRLIHASKLPTQLKSVIEYYSKSYGINFCGVDTSAEVLRYLASEREAAIMAYKQEHGQMPSDEHIESFAGGSCVDGYLFEVGRSPSKSRVYWLLYLGFAIVVIVSILLLVRWMRRVREVSEG